jgi:hypothetical protein
MLWGNANTGNPPAKVQYRIDHYLPGKGGRLLERGVAGGKTPVKYAKKQPYSSLIPDFSIP